MPDWIEDAARRVKEERARKQNNEETRQAIAGTLAINGSSIFENLLHAIEKDVELFAVHFPDAQKRLQKPAIIGSAQFQVLRQHTPDFLLHVEWDQKTTITWTITRGGRSLSGEFEMKYNPEGGGLYENGASITFSEASKKLIEPALEGLA